MESIVNDLTDNEKDFFHHHDDKSISDNLTFGNFLNSCTDCGIKYSISKEKYLYNDIFDNHTQINVELTGNSKQFSKLNCYVDGCDYNEQSTLDLQSQIDELTDKLNNVISKLENFNKNINDVKKEIALEENNDILYSDAYEHCLKIIENKFA